MPHIKYPYLIAGLIALAVCFFLWLPTLIRYRITARHLQIRLFGLPIRRVRLDNIKYLGTHPVFFAEKWPNTWFPSHHRFLVIRKKRGLIKNLLITPKHRYVFKAELDHARRALGLNETRPPGNTEFLERNRTDAEKGLQGGDHFTGPIPPAH